MNTLDYFLLSFHIVLFCLLDDKLSNHSLEIQKKPFIMNHAWQ